MKIAYLAAATAALWVQPARAVEFLFSVKCYVPVEEHTRSGCYGLAGFLARLCKAIDRL